MSKIEVNTVDAQCGSTITVGSSGKNVKIEGNDIRSNDYKASDGGNIINQCGTTITLGASGDTISLASGASQSGFGREGSVDWQTGSIKTSTFTATSGEGYFCNTSGGAFTVNLPAGSAGAIVAISDYTRTFQTNNLTITPNGSEKIGGQTGNSVLSTEGQAVTLVYVDGTEGWINVQETSNSIQGETFITATGGTITTSGNCKIHTFTGPGTFCVSQISNTPENNQVSYLVVAGAGGGGGSALGYYSGGGGGAGGFREYKSPVTPYTASPKNGNPGGTSVTVTATAFPITVGGGGNGGVGSGGPSAPPVRSGGNNGSNSVFSTITSAGGGGGGKSGSNPAPAGTAAGGNGGSGGGGGGYNAHPAGARGLGNTPPVSPPQGFNGGQGNGPSLGRGGGGGGATSGGTDAPTHGAHNAPGGGGADTNITGSPVPYSVGGNAGADCNSEADNGTANRGDGGQGGNNFSGDADGGVGGSGIVIIRYKYQ